MNHLRPYKQDEAVAESSVAEILGGHELSAQERHTHLMELIAMATGDGLDADGKEIDEDPDVDDMDWDVDEELFKYATVEGMHGKSCYMFGASNELRIKAVALVNHPLFEYFVMGVRSKPPPARPPSRAAAAAADHPPVGLAQSIMVMMTALAYESPGRQVEEGSFEDDVLKGIDLFICLLFTAEAAIRIIAQGFILGKDSYLHGGWNVLDFTIVVTAWIAILMRTMAEHTEANKEIIEILTSLRLVRPLHSLRYFKGVKTLTAALKFSGPQMATVSLLMTIFFVIFGSFGVELWQGVVSRTCDSGYLQGMDLPPDAGLALEALPAEQCPATLVAACLAEEAAAGNVTAGGAFCYAVPDSYKYTDDWMDASEAFGFDNMAQAMFTLFIMTTLDEWPMIQRQMQGSDCAMCGGSMWPLMLVMVILLALLGANLFIAVLTYSYSQVLARQHMSKVRLGELARQQDGPSAVVYMEGEMQQVAMHQLLGQHGIGLKYGAGAHAGQAMTTIKMQDETNDGTVDAIDTTGDGVGDVMIVGQRDTTGDGKIDTVLVEKLGTNEMAELSVVKDNPNAWPFIPSVSPHCRKIALSKWYEKFIAAVILLNAVVMASTTYPEHSWTEYLETTDYIFILIYVLEVVIKILGLGLKPYFAVPFHDIDFVVVLASLVSIAFPEAKGATASRMIRLVLRVIRMLRLLKLVSGVDTVVYLVKALTTSGKSLLYMTSLIGFFVVLVATITMHIFGNCEGHGELLRNQSRTNFYTFGNSILANVQMLTGEDWAPVAFMHMDVCGWAAAPFFTAIIILYNFVLMNLFTAIILQNFSVSEHDKLRHQKESFRKDRGKQAIEEDMAILEWLAEAAAGDDGASKAIQAAMESMHGTQEKMGHCMEKLCGPCHRADENDGMDGLIELQRLHVEKKAEVNDLNSRLKTLAADRDAKKEEDPTESQRLAEELEMMEQQKVSVEAQAHALGAKIVVEKENLEQLAADGQASKATRMAQAGPHSYSCCCLKQNNKLRHFCEVVTTHDAFDTVILLAIFASSICLAYNPETEPDYIKTVSHICTFIFVLECVMKIIDLNFVKYARDAWNLMDFLIVCAAVGELIIPLLITASEGAMENLNTLKILRMLRLLRALRAIKHVEQLRVIVDVLVGCLPTVFAALAIVMIIYICFGILGLSLFGGLFWRCECVSPDCSPPMAETLCNELFYGAATVNDDDRLSFADPCEPIVRLRPSIGSDGVELVQKVPNPNYQGWLNESLAPLRVNMSACCLYTEESGPDYYSSDRSLAYSPECQTHLRQEVYNKSGGMVSWRNPAFNFDSIGSAIKTMFYMATTEGWVTIMWAGQDVPERPGLPPVKDLSYGMWVYFVMFQMIGAAFSMSLFTGVLTNYFAESSGSGILTRRQKEWVHAKLLVLRAHSVPDTAPQTPVRKTAHDLYTWAWWELVVSVVIMIQVLVIVLVGYPPMEWQGWLGGNMELVVNTFCLLFFSFEVLLGIAALSFTNYWRSAWNKFDVAVVVVSWAALALESSARAGWTGDLPLPHIQSLRATRIIRILTLFKGSTNLKAIFAALVLSLPAVINITTLMLLIFFVFGVLGMHLYSEHPMGEMVNEHENFNSTANAMKLLFEVATGHDFYSLIHEMQSNAEPCEVTRVQGVTMEVSDGGLRWVDSIDVTDANPAFSTLTCDADNNRWGGAFAYFFIFYVSAAFIMLNLFVAMLLENVQISLASEKSVIQSEHTDAFKKEWDKLLAADKSQKNGDKLNCYDVIELIRNLDEPLGRVDEIAHWEHRLLLELQVGLQVNRRKTYVTFENALMSTCVLYLSNSCLPYHLQHKRMMDVLHQQQDTAARLIKSRISQMLRRRKIPKTLAGLDGTKAIKLDTAAKKSAYLTAVRVFGNIAYNQIIRSNKVGGITNDSIKPRGKLVGQVKLRFERQGNDGGLGARKTQSSLSLVHDAEEMLGEPMRS